MKQKSKMRLLLLVMLALLSVRTLADNTENTALYLVTMAGIDQLKIEMPVYDEDGYDGYIDNGYVYVTPAGGSQQTLLRYYTKSKSGSKPTVYFYKGVDGAMTLSRDQGESDVTVSTTEKNCQIPSVPNKEYFKMYITWRGGTT